MRQLFLYVIFVFCTAHHATGQERDSVHLTMDEPQPIPNSLDIAKNFIYDLAAMNIAVDVILSQHVLVKEADDEMYDFLLASLDEIRLNLMSKNVGDIQFIKYTDMPRREVSDIDTEGKDVANMYFLRYRKRQMTSLYIEQGKIASFTLVSKGNNKAHFVTY